MRALLVTEGVLSETMIAPTLEGLQKAVGGYIEAAFTVPSKDGGCVTGYVDEEGIVKGKTLNVRTYVGGQQYNDGLCGPLVITGLTDDGETRGLSVREAEVLRLAFSPNPLLLPTRAGLYVIPCSIRIPAEV